MLSKAPCAVTGLRESVNSLLIYHTHAGILFTLEKGVSQLSSISLSHVQWRSNDYTERLKGKQGMHAVFRYFRNSDVPRLQCKALGDCIKSTAVVRSCIFSVSYQWSFLI